MTRRRARRRSSIDIHCQCGCTLDVYTCRTTDFSCQVSPAMHRDVMALVEGGYGAQEIIDAFVGHVWRARADGAEEVGFNLLAWLHRARSPRSAPARWLVAVVLRGMQRRSAHGRRRRTARSRAASATHRRRARAPRGRRRGDDDVIARARRRNAARRRRARVRALSGVLRRDRAGATRVDRAAPPSEVAEHDAVAALREIEFDRATGKLSDADYAELKARYTREATRGDASRRARRRRGSAPTTTIEAAVRAYRERMRAAPTCGPRPEPDAVFCSDCGRYLPDRCAGCGAPVAERGARFCVNCGDSSRRRAYADAARYRAGSLTRASSRDAPVVLASASW